MELLKTDEYIKIAKRMVQLDDSQAVLKLLTQCASTPKIIYLLRTTPDLSPDAINAYDYVTQQLLDRTLNAELNYEHLSQASLPYKKAGLSVRKARDVYLPALIGSTLESILR